MPLIRVNAVGDRPVPDGDLAEAVEALPDGAPIIVLIHGFKYRPEDSRRCPHKQILSLAARQTARIVSWPRHLGFGRGQADEGLCVAFGWSGTGLLWQAYAEAARAGRALSALIADLQILRPGPVHLVGHSLGARVALSSFEGLPDGTIGRTILLAAADTRAQAEAALGSPAGRSAEIVNVRSRENTLFDLLLRAAIFPHRPGLRALGAGLGRRDPRWVDLAIDCEASRAHLRALGFRIPPPLRRICHWSAYLRPGLFPLYRALLRESLPLAALRPETAAAAVPDTGHVTVAPTRLRQIFAGGLQAVSDPSWASRHPSCRRQPSA